MGNKIFAAIDVGTTTVAVSLIDEENRVIIKDGFLNPQSRFGSDVISRITLSERGDNLANMRTCIIEAIEGSISSMIGKMDLSSSESAADDDDDDDEVDQTCLTDKDKRQNVIDRAVITANTAMASIILGKNITSLGKAPFDMPFNEESIITLNGNITCHVLPGASAFIGADSAAGAMYIQDINNKSAGDTLGESLRAGEMLIDLGTNGEMLLNDGTRMLALSAACGPAFENSTRASKIYGKTTLSAIAYLLKRGELDRNLVLDDDFIQNGRDITISETKLHLDARIIREIQLATAAIYASAVFLIEQSDISMDDIKRLYIAGGFGFYLSLSDAETIGLLPSKLLSKAVVAGNTSLMAAEKLAITGDIEKYDSFRKSIITLQPGGNERYEELFRDNLTFTKR
ncbi:MAG: ASKHA domain-containing protein [Eubacterium sp.]|nr:ASKHA domain-containing protein [Eubacterium sp.]